MRRVKVKILSILLTLCLVFSFGAGCGSSGEKNADTTNASSDTSSGSTQTENLPLLEYTAYTENVGDATDAPGDVVTPYIEKKFNIRVKDFLETNTQTFVERVNQWIAADNLPDVFLTSQVEFEATYKLGIYADVEKYVGNMTNYNKYFDEKFWPYFKNEGVLYQIPVVQVNLNDPKYANDPYFNGNFAHGLWVREDLLAKTGYKFKPIDQIKAEAEASGKKPTLEDFKIEPEIKTPDDFYLFLKKVKDLNITVNGKPLHPFAMKASRQWHLGNMFDFGHWRIDEKGNVEGYLGTPEAKTYFKWLNKLYKEGLIDPDFLITKDDQVQEKIASGRVGSSLILPREQQTQEALLAINPDAKIRYIPWPKNTPNKGFYDAYKGGFQSVCINKDFEDIERLINYFDWFYSDEGLDICTWGPEEAGLWEWKDGKKVFKDKEVEHDILNGIEQARGYDYYGLFDWKNLESPWNSRAARAVPFLAVGNPFSYMRSYPVKLDILGLNRNLCGANGFNYDGTCVYGDGTEVANGVSTWYWDLFQPQLSAQLATAKTDAEFEAAWDTIYKQFLEEANYEKSREGVKKFFESLGK